MQNYSQNKDSIKGKSSIEIARLYLQNKKPEEALKKFESWLKKVPYDKDAWLDYGAALFTLGRVEQGLAATKKCLELAPGFPLATNNTGLYYQMMNDGKTATKWYAKASADGYTEANFNLALSMLRELMDNLTFDEKWDAAWDVYEWRFKKASPVPLPSVPPHMTFWDGKSPVMALTEQGVGDTIMFARYFPLLPAGSVLAIPEALNPIFAGLPIINDTTHAGSVTQWAPMATICSELKCIPTGTPLRSGGSKIGVCWQGNKDHANDRHRSYPQLKASMLKLPSAVSLQFGHNPNIKNWQDTLDILKDCHTVVTIDTSIAHLAGHLGIRTLVLMPRFDWDFRWGTSSKNHWYPSITAYSTWKDLLLDI